MSAITPNSWRSLRRFTAARIGGGRAGNALPTRENLAFALDHARARDAVHQQLDMAALADALQGFELPVIAVHSAAADRATYLQRPDLGRRLLPADRNKLQALAGDAEIAIVVADGLSSLAVQAHAPALLGELLPLLRAQGLRLAPLVLVEQGRVAIGDDIAGALGARLSLLLIGERPGLSSPDSLGLYLTWAPRPGRVDAERNCISNVRPPEGLSYARAAETCLYLCRNALRRQLSGVRLKDDSLTLEGPGSRRVPFLPALDSD